MRNYWHVWYVLSYDSIRATIRHIIFSVYHEHLQVNGDNVDEILCFMVIQAIWGASNAFEPLVYCYTSFEIFAFQVPQLIESKKIHR
jgi:hypothetical protein